MMNIEKKLFEEQVAYLVLYNLEGKDTEELKDFSKVRSIDIIDPNREREQILRKINPAQFTSAQKLLVTLYLQLYAALHGRDIREDDRIKNIFDTMGVNTEFSKISFQAMRRLAPEVILETKTPLMAIIEPSMETADWANEIVCLASKDGHYIRKLVVFGLNSKEYEHRFDKQALNMLEGTPGLETIVKQFNKHGVDRLLRIQYTGSNVKITKEVFPQISEALEQVCKILDCYPIPDLYTELGFINARTMGVEKPIIVLTSGTISLLSYDELLFLIGHEVGHIKSQHTLYHQMADIFPLIGDILGSATLGIGGLLSKSVELALLNWQRMSEFTADRAGLLACQNVDAATTAMMKIAGVPPKYYPNIQAETFKKQAMEFEGFDSNNMDRVAKALSVMFASHPWTVMRGHELYKWIDSGEYGKILERHQNIVGAVDILQCSPSCENNTKFCTNCGERISATMKFCTNCGTSCELFLK